MRYVAKCYLCVSLGLHAMLSKYKCYCEAVGLNQLLCCFQANFSKEQMNLSMLSITFLDKFGLTQSVLKSIEWNL